MANKRNLFSLINDYASLCIFVSDSSPLEVIGVRTIDLMIRKINNVQYVSGLSSNLLLVFQITHLGYGKAIYFYACDVLI